MELLDTNALIHLFIESDGNISYEDDLAISRITYIEFMSYRDMSEDEVEAYSKILEDNFVIVELDQELSDSAAFLRRKFGIALGDSIILATAIDEGFTLVTNDKRLKRKYDKLIAT